MTLTSQNLQNRVGYWHIRLAQALENDLERRLAPHGVTVAQMRLLVTIGRGDAYTVRGLASLLGLDGAAISRLADRLEAKRLLRRENDPSDARSVRLRLTPAGASLAPVLASEADAHERAWFGSLSFAELRQYKATLARLLPADGVTPDAAWLRSELLR